MNALGKLLVLLIFAGFGLTVYAGSMVGWGISGPMDKKTMSQIKQNCPDYYKNRNGDCLRTTFRSYYLMRGVRGGSFGSGK
jgi:hypothetical protein